MGWVIGGLVALFVLSVVGRLVKLAIFAAIAAAACVLLQL